MKRLISLLFVIAMLMGVFALVACGDDETTNTTTSKEDTNVTDPKTTTSGKDPETEIPVPDADLYALYVDDMKDPVGIR